ncbi:MAG: type II toxin-antitoxin system antitoxin SocA domain-containing protein [Peptococcales bacterium]
MKELAKDEIDVLDAVIEEVGGLKTQEIIDKMHDEDAYKYTDSYCIIPFTFAEKLSLN